MSWYDGADRRHGVPFQEIPLHEPRPEAAQPEQGLPDAGWPDADRRDPDDEELGRDWHEDPGPAWPEGTWDDLRGPVLVTGTDTGVGKTVVAAAIATSATSAGLRVAVVKPAETGTDDGAPGDVAEIVRLAAPATAVTLAEYPDPLAPLVAARVAHAAPLALYDVVDAVRAQAKQHDLVLVEGAGGLLVPMGVRPSGEAWTVADLALLLGASAVVVTRPGLGTLNHTALTLEALERRSLPTRVVIGAWPAQPGPVHWTNLSELRPHLAGAVPDGASELPPGVFQRSAPGWLTPQLYGVLDDWRIWTDDID